MSHHLFSNGCTNFSLAVLPNENESFVSSSEDRTLKIWKGKYGVKNLDKSSLFTLCNVVNRRKRCWNTPHTEYQCKDLVWFVGLIRCSAVCGPLPFPRIAWILSW